MASIFFPSSTRVSKLLAAAMPASLLLGFVRQRPLGAILAQPQQTAGVREGPVPGKFIECVHLVFRRVTTPKPILGSLRVSARRSETRNLISISRLEAIKAV